MKKIRCAIRKSTKSSWNEPYSSSSFTKVMVTCNMYNKFVFSRFHWLQMWHCPRLLLSAVLRRRATAALLPATGLYQSWFTAATVGQTDRQTDARQLHGPCFANANALPANTYTCKCDDYCGDDNQQEYYTDGDPDNCSWNIITHTHTHTRGVLTDSFKFILVRRKCLYSHFVLIQDRQAFTLSCNEIFITHTRCCKISDLKKQYLDIIKIHQ